MHSVGFPELVLFIFFFTVIILLPVLFLRYRKQMLAHQERMVAIEKGASLPPLPAENGSANPRLYLLRGLIWLLAGFGLTVFLIGLSTTSVQPVPLSQRLFDAQRLRADGGTPEQVERLINTQESRQRIPIGLALIGLVPVGVGLAYLIFYAGERKHVARPATP